MTPKQLKKWISKEFRTDLSNDKLGIYKKHNINVLQTAIGFMEYGGWHGIKLKIK